MRRLCKNTGEDEETRNELSSLRLPYIVYIGHVCIYLALERVLALSCKKTLVK